MKKTLTLLLIAIPFFGFSQFQIQKQQTALLTKKTATWCNPCGSWGWNLQKDMITDNKDKAIILSVQFSSSDSYLYNATNGSFQTNFPYVGSTPAWYVNGKNRTAYASGGGIYTSTTQSNVKKAVDSTYLITPLANCGFNYTLVGNSLSVNAQSKFFSAASGEYYLAIYLIENKVITYQNGIGSSASHENVLRGSASSTWYGDKIVSGSINTNQTFNTIFNTTINANWKVPNLYLVGVIWKKVGSNYEYVNAYSNKTTLIHTGVNEVTAKNFQITSFPNLVSQNTNLNLDVDKTINDVTVSIFDISGRMISNIYNGQLAPGSHRFPVDIADMENGFYIARISSGDEQLVRKFVVQK